MAKQLTGVAGVVQKRVEKATVNAGNQILSKRFDHSIYIYEASKGKSSGILIPWLPSEIETNLGDIRSASIEIMDLGEVDIPTGNNLGRVSWSGTFPGAKRKGHPLFAAVFQYPKVYINKLDTWKKNGTKLKLLVSGTTINYNVYCESFTYRRSGGYGDVSYDVTFKQRREIVIKTVKKAATKSKNKAKSSSTSTTKYKIKSRDTLWGIASKYLGSGARWKEIYKLNKTIIENTAKKYGRKNSDGGKWIYPGVTIKIPKK